MNDTFMKEKPVFGLVLSMSLPMVLSMMVNSLYNIVDSYFVARISEDAMTALSLVYPVQNLGSVQRPSVLVWELMRSLPFSWEQEIRKKRTRRPRWECSGVWCRD